jgi:hypothetical protein
MLIRLRYPTAAIAAVAHDVMVYWLNKGVPHSFSCPPGCIDLEMIKKSMEIFVATTPTTPGGGNSWKKRMLAQAKLSAADLLSALTEQVGQIRGHDPDYSD